MYGTFIVDGEQLTCTAITAPESWEGFSELTNISLKDLEMCVG